PEGHAPEEDRARPRRPPALPCRCRDGRSGPAPHRSLTRLASTPRPALLGFHGIHDRPAAQRARVPGRVPRLQEGPSGPEPVHLPLPSTIGAASAIGYFCRSSFEEGLGAFGLGVELQVPGRPNGAEVIVKALRHYTIPRDAMEFYFIHVEAEEEHGGNAEAALAPFTRTREQQALVRRAFQWTV